MPNNIIMFFNSNIEDDFNATPSLCVYDNQIINCNITMSSAVDMNAFAPYDSAELTILNRTNVHSTINIDNQLNDADLFRIGTIPPLTNTGAESSASNYMPVGGVFYIENIVDKGGGIRKISGKSITALLENSSYGGIYNNTSLHDVINALYSGWHSFSTVKIALCNTSAQLSGMILSNTRRNVLGQVLFSYGMYVDYNRSSMPNLAPVIKEIKDTSQYELNEHYVYTGGCYTSLVSQRELALNFQLVGLTYTLEPNADANGRIPVANVNVRTNYDLAKKNEISPIYTVTLNPPVASLDDLRISVGIAGNMFRYNVHACNGALTPNGIFRYEPAIGSAPERDISWRGYQAIRENIIVGCSYSAENRLNDIDCARNIFSDFKEVSVNVNLLNIPFPWIQADSTRAGNSFQNWSLESGWRATTGIGNNFTKCYHVILTSTGTYEENITMLFFVSNRNNELLVESELNSINGINFITPSLANTVGNRILNFMSASATEKLSFPWNGSAPGDMLQITNLNGVSRCGIITDMKIQLSSFPKATANIRYNFTGV